MEKLTHSDFTIRVDCPVLGVYDSEFDLSVSDKIIIEKLNEVIEKINSL